MTRAIGVCQLPNPESCTGTDDTIPVARHYLNGTLEMKAFVMKLPATF